MPDVRYVCLSDLHFGARSSILTGLEHVDDVDPGSPGSRDGAARSVVNDTDAGR